MPIVLDRLVYRYEVEADTSGLDAFEESQDSAGVSAIALGGFVGNMATKLVEAGAAAAKAAVNFGKDLVFGTAAANDEIAKTAKNLGLTTDEFQRLTFASEQSGVSARGLRSAVKDLRFRLGEAARGGAKPFADALADVGLSIEQLQGADAETQLGMIGDALNRVEDESLRASIGTQLLGGQFSKMSNLLAGGSQGLSELGDAAEKYGAVISEDTLEASEDFQDRLNESRKVIGAIKQAVFRELLPVARQLVVTFRDWANGNRDIIAARFKEFVEGLIGAFKTFAEVVGFLMEHWQALAITFTSGALVAGIAAVGSSVGGMAGAMSLALGPIGLLAAALVGLIANAEEAKKAFEEVLGLQETIKTNERGARQTIGDQTSGLNDEERAEFAALAEEVNAINSSRRTRKTRAAQIDRIEKRRAELLALSEKRLEEEAAIPIGPVFDPAAAAQSERKGGGGGGGGKPKAEAKKQKSLAELIEGATGTGEGLLGLDSRGGAAGLGGVFVTQDNRLTITLPAIELTVNPGNTGALSTSEGAAELGDGLRGQLDSIFTEIRDHYQGRVI